MPGEHDAAADGGAAYREMFGESALVLDHKGIHFVAIDNVSDPTAKVGDEQLAWLRSDLASLTVEAPIVVFCHVRLGISSRMGLATPDAAKVIDVLSAYHNVTVFSGNIHQELHHMTGNIAHHAARSTMFALPTPETPGTRTPVPWDPANPNQGLGYRTVEAATNGRTTTR